MDWVPPSGAMDEAYYCPAGTKVRNLNRDDAERLEQWQKKIADARADFSKDAKVIVAGVVRYPAPDYFAKEKPGWVTVTVVVDADGNPAFVSVYCSSRRKLETRVLEAVRSWKFSPERIDGKAVPSIGRIPVSLNSHRK